MMASANTDLVNGIHNNDELVRRPIVLDSMNIMHQKNNSFSRGNEEDRRTLDCSVILRVVRYFIERCHLVYVIIPNFCLRQRLSQSFRNNDLLMELKSHFPELLIEVNYLNHDDLIALMIANDTFGSIVTQDKYRDHRGTFDDIDTVCRRNISMHFPYRGDDTRTQNNSDYESYCKKFQFVIHPQEDQSVVPNPFYCSPDQPEYEFLKEEQLSREDAKRIIDKIDILIALSEARFIQGINLPEEHIFRNWDKLPATIGDYERIYADRTRSALNNESQVSEAPEEGAFMSIDEARQVIALRLLRKSQRRNFQ